MVEKVKFVTVTRVVDGAMNSIYEWFDFEEDHVTD